MYLYCRQEVLLLDNEISFNEEILEEREHGIQEVQQQIGEVNDIFKDLAVLVHEQGTMIGIITLFHFSISVHRNTYIDVCSFFLDDIGSNIENSHAATAQGRSQLAKAAKTQRSNSSLVLPYLNKFSLNINLAQFYSAYIPFEIVC